jgi:putative molybdopterin biosynthesis protein
MNKEAFSVNTGNPIPQGTDAVIMIEDVHLADSERAEIRDAAYPWQHVRPIGEDMIATEMVLPENHKITPYDLGALLASGNREVAVKKKPRVGILPTGSELLEPRQALCFPSPFRNIEGKKKARGKAKVGGEEI